MHRSAPQSAAESSAVGVLETGTKEKGWWWGLPPWWWLFVLVVALTAAGFVWSQGISACPGWEGWGDLTVPKGRWTLVAAVYIFFLFLGHLVIQLIQRLFDILTTLELTGIDRKKVLNRPNTFPATFVGFVEGILYPTSLLANKPEFIAAWIVLKVAGQWKVWEAEHAGRRVFNRFLFGSGLSFGMGSLTYLALRVLAFC